MQIACSVDTWPVCTSLDYRISEPENWWCIRVYAIIYRISGFCIKWHRSLVVYSIVVCFFSSYYIDLQGRPERQTLGAWRQGKHCSDGTVLCCFMGSIADSKYANTYHVSIRYLFYGLFDRLCCFLP